MKQATRERLNALNLAFYDSYATQFSEKRTRPWRGFGRVLAQLRAPAPRVLDIGCGNGRLIPALAARFEDRFEYLGIDASAPLLAIASARYACTRVRFERADFVAIPPERALPDAAYDGVCLFGVVHHVPGEAARRALLEAARARVAAGGLLAFTLWRFEREPRFLERRVAKVEFGDGLALSVDELDPGDALLRWGSGGAVARYCHAVDEPELARLLHDLDLELVERFGADGASGELNDYLVFRAQN